MASNPRSALARRRRGFALLIVFLLIIALILVVHILQREVAREVAISANVRDDLVASEMANLGIIRGAVMLRLDDEATYDSLNEVWSKPLNWDGENFGSDGDGSEAPQPPQIFLTDEERKFNLLTLVRGNEDQRKMAVEVLTRLINICRRDDKRLSGQLEGAARSVRRADDDTANTETLVRNLLKYLEERASEDGDEMEFTSEAEGTDVRGMKKQTPFQMLTLGELLQVEGWTRQLLHGPPRVHEGADGEPEEEKPYASLTEEERFDRVRQQVEDVDTRSRDPNQLPLLPYLTLYSSGRINVNTAPREVLLALSEDITWDMVDLIMTAREQDRRDVAAAEESGQIPEEPLEGTGETEDNASFRPQDLATFTAFMARINTDPPAQPQPTQEGEITQEIYDAIRPWLVVRSTVFRVDSVAKSGKTTHRMYAIYRRTGPPAQPQQPGGNQPPGGNPPPAQQPQDRLSSDTLPAEPQLKLTLLLRDIGQQ